MTDAALWTHGEANVIGRGMRCARLRRLAASQRRERAAGNREGIDDPQCCGPLQRCTTAPGLALVGGGRPWLASRDGRRSEEVEDEGRSQVARQLTAVQQLQLLLQSSYF